MTLGRFGSEREEAQWIARQILALRDEGAGPAEIAVFYRTNAQSRPLEDAMMDYRLPYQLIGGVRFYERKEIKDIVAYLRLFVNPSDALALERLLDSRPFGVGAASFAKVVACADAQGLPVVSLLLSEELPQRLPKVPPAVLRFAVWLKKYLQLPQDEFGEFIRLAVEESGLPEYYREQMKKESREALPGSSDQGDAEDRLENLNAFLARAAEFALQHEAPTLAAFLEVIALNSSADELEDGQEKVTLMTLHCSKGLEFPYVFIAGVEQGLLPHVTSYNEGNEEEERRLFYVGITRAERKLFLSHAMFRFQWGETNASRPSPFLGELPEELLLQVGGVRHPAKVPWWQRQLPEEGPRRQGFPGGRRSTGGASKRDGGNFYDFEDL